VTQANQQTVQDLRREAQEAMEEVGRLARRLGSIDAEIQAERQRIAADRVGAARRGESVAAAGDRLTLEGLEAERVELPELHFAARLKTSATNIAAEEAVIAETVPQVEQAEKDLEPLVEALAEAQAAVDAQKAHLGQLRGVVSGARERRKRHEAMIVQVEAEGPRKLA